MKILKAIVDELPVSCYGCDFLSVNIRNVVSCANDHERLVHRFHSTRHPDCPLEENGEIVSLREDNERLRTQNKQLLEVVGLMDSMESEE